VSDEDLELAVYVSFAIVTSALMGLGVGVLIGIALT
jgi:hypothetical protein